MCHFDITDHVCGHSEVTLRPDECEDLQRSRRGRVYCNVYPGADPNTIPTELLHHTPPSGRVCGDELCLASNIVTAYQRCDDVVRRFEGIARKYHRTKLITRQSPELDPELLEDLAQVFELRPVGGDVDARGMGLESTTMDLVSTMVRVQKGVLAGKRWWMKEMLGLAQAEIDAANAILNCWSVQLLNMEQMVEQMYAVERSWAPDSWQMLLHETVAESKQRWEIAKNWLHALLPEGTVVPFNGDWERATASFFVQYGPADDGAVEAFVGWSRFWMTARPRRQVDGAERARLFMDELSETTRAPEQVVDALAEAVEQAEAVATR